MLGPGTDLRYCISCLLRLMVDTFKKRNNSKLRHYTKRNVLPGAGSELQVDGEPWQLPTLSGESVLLFYVVQSCFETIKGIISRSNLDLLNNLYNCHLYHCASVSFSIRISQDISMHFFGSILPFTAFATAACMARFPKPHIQPWVPPGPDDSRGPCPMINTLANHGYL